MAEKSGAAKKRQDVKNDYWPNEDPWTGEGEVGWFKGSRTLPLFLSLLNEKAISGNNDPRSTYVELLSRQMGEGIIEMGHEKDHAFAAGYSSTRGVRTWTDNMKILEANGFIRMQSMEAANRRFEQNRPIKKTRRQALALPGAWGVATTLQAHVDLLA